MFNKAIAANPNGGTRARIGMAEIALRQGDYQTAKKQAFAALQFGRFHAKTIRALPLFLHATYQLGETNSERALMSGLAQAKATVRNRATLAIASALRAQANPGWKQIANEWLKQGEHKDAKIAAEFKKLFLADARLVPDLAKQNAASLTLLNAAGLSPKEFLTATKEYIRTILLQSGNVNVASLAGQAAQKFGPAWRNKVLHGAALSALTAKRPDIAKSFLQQVVGQGVADRQGWKSLWALARTEAGLNNHREAAELYRRFSDTTNAPTRFKTLARIKWAQELLASGTLSSSEGLKQDLSASLSQIMDGKVLLELSRQLTNASPALDDLAEELLNRGEAIALNDFRAAKTPATALNILLNITRRQVYDFAKYDRAIATWKSLTDQQRQFLWSTKSEYWEYIALVVTSLTYSAQEAAASNLADEYMRDSATPIEGRLRILSAIADASVARSRPNDAMATFASMIALAPAHRFCAQAYYWLALAEKKSGNQQKSADYASKIQLSLGPNKGLATEQQLDCQASLLKSNLRVGAELLNSSYDSAFQTACAQRIARDLRKL